jgi:transcriptional regulator of PTS gene
MLNEMGAKLGKSLAGLIQILNPDLIIIGGRFSVAGEPFLHHIVKNINQYALPRLIEDCDIKCAERGEKAAMLGAYTVVLERFLGH